jgi:hypothetical protein
VLARSSRTRRSSDNTRVWDVVLTLDIRHPASAESGHAVAQRGEGSPRGHYDPDDGAQGAKEHKGHDRVGGKDYQ